jgi:putative ABC transport system substrate-binding protein
MKRRDFIRIAAGSAAVWPLAAHAQRADRVPTIGILAGVSPEDPQGKAIVDALSRGLQEFGWIDGKSAKMHYRGSSDPEQLGKYATELTTLAPDIMVATGGTSVGPRFHRKPFAPRGQRHRFRAVRIQFEREMA